MRIGVTNPFKGSAFGGALPQVALFMATAFKDAGHDVTFLVPTESDDWFIDCSGCKDIPSVKSSLSCLTGALRLAWLLFLGPFLIHFSMYHLSFLLDQRFVSPSLICGSTSSHLVIYSYRRSSKMGTQSVMTRRTPQLLYSDPLEMKT